MTDSHDDAIGIFEPPDEDRTRALQQRDANDHYATLLDEIVTTQGMFWTLTLLARIERRLLEERIESLETMRHMLDVYNACGKLAGPDSHEGTTEGGRETPHSPEGPQARPTQNGIRPRAVVG